MIKISPVMGQAFVFLAALGQAFDIGTTLKILKDGGVENRKINKTLQVMLGPEFWAPIKLITMVLLLWLIFLLFSYNGLFGLSIAFAGTGFWYGFANLKVIRK